MPGIPKDRSYFENDIDQITFHSSLSASTNGEATAGCVQNILALLKQIKYPGDWKDFLATVNMICS